MVFINLVYPSSVLRVQINLPVNFNPCARLTATVSQNILAVINKFDFGMLLAQVRRLDIHCQVDSVRVSRAKELPVRGSIDKQELPTKDTVCAFEQVVVIASFA